MKSETPLLPDGVAESWFHVHAGGEVWTSRVCRGADLLKVLDELMGADARDAERLADADNWYVLDGKCRSISFACGEDPDIQITMIEPKTTRTIWVTQMSQPTKSIPIDVVRPKGGFRIVLADPPWNYRDKNSNGKRGASHKYACLTTDDVARLDVRSLCAPDAVLLLWATPPMIKDALRVIEAWGFTYKTFGFLWAKRNRRANTPFFGLGHWTRANVEPCLLATLGKPKRASAAVSQFVWTPIERHSEKPAVVRERIVELCGDVPRLELFSRHIVPGWTRWGSEVLP